MTILTGSQIEGARLLTLRQMLRLEIAGMSKSRGPTAYSTLRTLGFKGSRKKVLAQLNEIRNQLTGESK
jgi:succinylarginine dihydrolase